MIYGYIGLKIIPNFGFDKKVKAAVIILIVFSSLSIVIYMILMNLQMGGAFRDRMAWITYINFGLISILCTFYLAKDVTIIAIWLFQKISNIFSSNPTSLIDPSRREFLKSVIDFSILGTSFLITGYGLFRAMTFPKLKKVEVPTENIPEEIKKLKIIQISDVHIGPMLKADFVQRLVEKINEETPDIVAITGDLIDGSVQELKEQVKYLKNIKSKHGVYFVTGNHEYYSGAESWIKHINEMGITVLNNEHRIIELGDSKLMIAGVVDISTKRHPTQIVHDPEASVKGAPLCDYKILLAHQPTSIFESSAFGFDLQLSGHTHGGQYFPFTSIIKLFQPFVAGLYKYKNTQLYVSKGTGFWGPPLRAGADSEITEIILT